MHGRNYVNCQINGYKQFKGIPHLKDNTRKLTQALKRKAAIEIKLCTEFRKQKINFLNVQQGKYSKMSNLVSKLSAGMVNQQLKNVLKKNKKVAHLAVIVQGQMLYMDKPRCGLNRILETQVALGTF